MVSLASICSSLAQLLLLCAFTTVVYFVADSSLLDCYDLVVFFVCVFFPPDACR